MSHATFWTVSYKGAYIHGAVEGNTETITVRFTDGTKARARSLRGARNLITRRMCCGMRDTYVNMVDRKLHCATCGRLVK